MAERLLYVWTSSNGHFLRFFTEKWLADNYARGHGGRVRRWRCGVTYYYPDLPVVDEAVK